MIRVEFKRKIHGDAGAMKEAIEGLAPAIAAALARVVRRRVQAEGHPATSAPGYAHGKGGFILSPRYPVQPSGGQARKDGTTSWQHSAAFHTAARTRRGTYSVSGGMWDGLTVLIGGPLWARVMWLGRSEGQRPSPKRSKKGKVRGLKISNALKAASILRTTGVAILDPTESEWNQLSLAVQAWVARGVDRALWAEMTWSKSLDMSFLERRG